MFLFFPYLLLLGIWVITIRWQYLKEFLVINPIPFTKFLKTIFLNNFLNLRISNPNSFCYLLNYNLIKGSHKPLPPQTSEAIEYVILREEGYLLKVSFFPFRDTLYGRCYTSRWKSKDHFMWKFPLFYFLGFKRRLIDWHEYYLSHYEKISK